jgi:FXSXX-COOH protein
VIRKLRESDPTLVNGNDHRSSERRLLVIGHDRPSTRKPSPDRVDDIRGDLIDVSGFSLRELDELDKSVLAEELRRLLRDTTESTTALGFHSVI